MFAVISCKQNPNSEYHKQGNKFHDMFIAHGGGAVGGYTKTNSLEGLNVSYANGFRMFELDFQLTTDNKIVAVHDPIYSPEEEFLSQRIHNKFTPMNLEMVNEWFANHPDAILITDKINRPDLFAAQFKYKDRLIMELFTWETVVEAIALGITPMVSQNIFWKTPNIEKVLDSLDIKIVGMHRDAIENDKELLKRIKDKGIKTYVWFTKSKIEGMKPEEYIWKNDMEYCYGMNANDLDFLSSLLNENNEKK
jgi:glycerophosphoryl diester phosphodiesterase